jgi:hypothetical protein
MQRPSMTHESMSVLRQRKAGTSPAAAPPLFCLATGCVPTGAAGGGWCCGYCMTTCSSTAPCCNYLPSRWCAHKAVMAGPPGAHPTWLVAGRLDGCSTGKHHADSHPVTQSHGTSTPPLPIPPPPTTNSIKTSRSGTQSPHNPYPHHPTLPVLG